MDVRVATKGSFNGMVVVFENGKHMDERENRQGKDDNKNTPLSTT